MAAVPGHESPTVVLEPAVRPPHNHFLYRLIELSALTHVFGVGAHSLEELHVALLVCMHPDHHRQHDIATDYPGERLSDGIVAVAASTG
jgi:hypothetical protein